MARPALPKAARRSPLNVRISPVARYVLDGLVNESPLTEGEAIDDAIRRAFPGSWAEGEKIVAYWIEKETKSRPHA